MSLQLIEGMSSRKRRPNWTDQESLLLTQLLQERKSIIRGRYSTGVSLQEKRQAWEEIALAINNAFPQIKRTVSDCNKKWENLLAKSREEIKRQKRQAGRGGLSLEKLSSVTQAVISVMNLSDMLEQDNSSASDMVETQQNSSDEDGNDHKSEERFSTKRPLTDLELPSFPDPSVCPTQQKMTAFSDVPKSLSVQFSAPRAGGFTAPADRIDTPRSASPHSLHCTTLQERMDLEMSVLRRQEAVLKLQEEYYTLKIKLMKRQMKDQLATD